MTFEEAILNAARLLQEAELEVANLPRMERLEKLADSWIAIASQIREKERV